MKKKNAGIFFWKAILLLIPLLLFLGTYLYYDPFRVIHQYDNYEKDCFVALDRDFVGTEVYLKNREKEKYNAFIFGNSRSLSFLCSDWQHYVPGASTFHYDGSGESLTDLKNKIKFIDEKNGKLDHALLIFDGFLLSLTDPVFGPTSEPHPSVSKTSWVSFHSTFFKSYLSEFYFIKYLDYKYNRKFKPYMKGVIETRPIDYNPVTNDFYLKIYDEEMDRDAKGYMLKHADAYHPRDTVNTNYDEAVIGEKQLKMLSAIRAVFTKHHTQYKIVISPPYEQTYFNKTDLAKLDSIFGKENVYDFSGRNEYTRNPENYYEAFHYRPRVARDIMRRIYGSN